MTIPPQPIPPTGHGPGGQQGAGLPHGAPATSHPLNVPPGVPAPPPSTKPPKSNPLTSKPVIGIAGLVLGLVFGAGLGGSGQQAAVTAPGPTVTVTATSEASDEPTDEPTEEETTPAPDPAPAKKTYHALSSRDFKLLTKDPDAYTGKTYVIYGEITQFDAATGTDTFRANTGSKKLKISYGFVDYPQNSFLTGAESRLKKLVEGDCFKAKVTVLGSFSYDTQAGGSTTVPLFQVDAVSVYGSTD